MRVTIHNHRTGDVAPGEYWEIRFDGRKRLVQIAGVRGGTITGFAVNRGGEKTETVTKTTVSTNLLVFKETDLVRQLYMNLHYGELE